VCMGRALMIPGFVGDNIDKVTRGKGNGCWEKLSPVVAKFGETPEQIFVTYETLKEKYGKQINDMPLGAVALYTLIDKLKTGLTQLMAGARSFRLDTVKRVDVVSLTEEASKISGIQYIMDAQREEAEAVLNGR
ncbi:MAG: FMN-binding glutamate synthase family protein, partial [Candidatus Omnitrophica bacterium]|nr:FMN-binding glutamate synthase family protein [Candidatus Omnitrophota bacterium]